MNATEEAVDIRELLAQVSKFYKDYEGLGRIIDRFRSDYLGLRANIVHLLNAQENLGRMNKDAEIKLLKVEQEAQTRLQTIEQGHRAIIDRVSKKEVELDGLKSELERREAKVSNLKMEAELLKAEYEKRLAALSSTNPAKKK